MKMFYIVLTQEFCEANTGYRNDCNVFGYAVTTDGRYVASVNALNEFSELFTNIPPVVALTIDDFPITIDVDNAS